MADKKWDFDAALRIEPVFQPDLRFHEAFHLFAERLESLQRFFAFSGSPGFLRLANALSALYPKGSEEKRLLDAMLLAVPR